MEANLLDFRRRMGDILRAIDRNEPVTLLCRGRERAVLVPLAIYEARRRPPRPMHAHGAFGIWRDHRGIQNAGTLVRTGRRSGSLAPR